LKNKLAIFFICFSTFYFSQGKNEIVQQRIEFIAEQIGSEDADLTPFEEILNLRLESPINLNKTTFEELNELGLLSEVQINDLLLHTQRFGRFISIYELQALKYWDLTTIDLVKPFVFIDERLDNLKISFKEAMKQGEFTVIARYRATPELKKGFEKVSDSIKNSSNTYYRGDNAQLFTRIRYTYKTNISIGVTGKKDPGEQFFKGAQKNGFDFYSAHAYFKGGKYLRAVALGDYSIQIGQGLNFWSGYAFGKTADVTSVKRSAIPIRPYASGNEALFLRGAAVDVGIGPVALTTFISAKKVDGAIVVDSTADEIEGNTEFTQSLNVTGYHRTNSEIARRHTLTEQIAGSNLRFTKKRFSLGIAGVYTGYNKPFIKDTQVYNQFDYRGLGQVTLSGDYSAMFRNFNFFGEVSRNNATGAMASVNGVLIALDPRASMVILHRNYGRGYNSLYNAGLAESSNPQNEQGLFMGWKYKFNSKWSLATYLDFFKSSWLKYLTDAPSSGQEILFQPTYKPNKIFEIYGRFREQVRQKNSRDSDGSITGIENVTQRNYRINVSYAISEDFTLKSRVEYVTINRKSNKQEAGFLIYQDILYKPKGKPLDIAFRYALFDTDSYDARMYAFENQALYAFSIPSYYYQGSRAYVLVRYTFLRKFDLWLRYGAFVYNNRKTLSSGSEEIKGNVKSDITVQLRFKL
jgi:hypothetical protein